MTVQVAQRQAFAVAHWGVGGEGTGYTIVVTSSERMARILVGDYLLGKNGGSQFAARHLLEVMPLEESTFAALQVDLSEGGIKYEYWFKPGEEEKTPELVYSFETATA